MNKTIVTRQDLATHIEPRLRGGLPRTVEEAVEQKKMRMASWNGIEKPIPMTKKEHKQLLKDLEDPDFQWFPLVHDKADCYQMLADGTVIFMGVQITEEVTPFTQVSHFIWDPEVSGL